jgi:hypothetical protein
MVTEERKRERDERWEMGDGRGIEESPGINYQQVTNIFSRGEEANRVFCIHIDKEGIFTTMQQGCVKQVHFVAYTVQPLGSQGNEERLGTCLVLQRRRLSSLPDSTSHGSRSAFSDER